MLLNTPSDGLSPNEISSILPDVAPYIHSNQLVLMNGLQSIEEFPMAYVSIRNCLDYCFWNTTQDFTIITTAYTLVETVSNTLPNYEREIISAFISGNNKTIDSALDNYYSFCRNTPIAKPVFLDSVQRLILLVSSLHLDKEKEDLNNTISFLSELETADEIIQYLNSFIFPDVVLKPQMPQIANALSYINTYYAEDVHLNDVAQAVALSSGYLSRIFKVETGYSFTEYLHHVRINKAKELIIHTTFKYYEIAEKVGYKDYKSFAAYFNKYCGCSAKEYKVKYKK